MQSTAIKGLIALSEGKVDIATGAHPLEDLVAGAARSGVVINPADLVATPVEENRLVVIANKENPVDRLSKEQLKGIFTGTITSWKGVGGVDAPVQVVWGKETQGQNIQFTRTALENQSVTAKARQVATYRDISETVRQHPGGIGVVPLQLATGATKAVETVSLPTQMYVITRGKPGEKVQQVIDFYKKEFTFN